MSAYDGSGVWERVQKLGSEAIVFVSLSLKGRRRQRPRLYIWGERCAEIYEQMRLLSAKLLPAYSFPNEPTVNDDPVDTDAEPGEAFLPRPRSEQELAMEAHSLASAAAVGWVV